MRIGIIKEGKVPIDRRVPLSPSQCREILAHYPKVSLKCQRSDIRCFPDEEYAEAGVTLADNVSDCEVILGVKEVPVDMLVPGKTHFFFSHTIKKQAYNRDLLRAILQKKIRLIDWECLTNREGQRLIAFGRYAGIAGAYNGMLTWGKRYNLFHLKPAHECPDMADMQSEYAKVKLPAVKIALTGGGRVSKGAMEVLYGMGIRRVSPAEFVSQYFDGPVFTQLNVRDYNRRTDGREFDLESFYHDPDGHESDFRRYASQADLLIAGAFWDPRAPVLFTRQEMVEPYFKIRVIADITCDIEGSIPSTKRSSTIDDPVYDYNPGNDRIEAAYSDEGNVSVMAVDNLPCELPRNASEDFGKEFIKNILPNLVGEDTDQIIARATITNPAGELTERFNYLQDYVDGV